MATSNNTGLLNGAGTFESLGNNAVRMNTLNTSGVITTTSGI